MVFYLMLPSRTTSPETPKSARDMPRPRSSRDAGVDVIRIGSITCVMVVHIYRSFTHFVPMTFDLDARVEGYTRVFIMFGMPILFWISGSSAAFSRDGAATYVRKKTARLILPLLFAYVFVQVPTMYLAIGQDTQVCGPNDAKGFLEYLKRFFGNFFECFGKCGFWWLWFLPVLWITAIVSYAVLKLTFGEGEKRQAILISIISTAVLVLIAVLVKDIAFVSGAVGLFVFFGLFGVTFNKVKPEHDVFPFLRLFFIPAFSAVYTVVTTIASWYSHQGVREAFLMTGYSYFFMFFCQGYISNKFANHQPKWQRYPKSYLLIFILQISVFVFCLPIINEDVDNILVFPGNNYIASRVAYLIGGWLWIDFIYNAASTKWADLKVNEMLEDANKYVMVFYCFHYLYIAFFNKYIVMPFIKNYYLAFVLHLAFDFTMSFITAKLISRTPGLRGLFGFDK